MIGDWAALVALLAVLAVLVVLAWAYDRCKLDPYLAPRHRKCGKAVGGFVGAMAQHPSLVPCAFPAGPGWQMNRCNYV